MLLLLPDAYLGTWELDSRAISLEQITGSYRFTFLTHLPLIFHCWVSPLSHPSSVTSQLIFSTELLGSKATEDRSQAVHPGSGLLHATQQTGGRGGFLVGGGLVVKAR